MLGYESSYPPTVGVFVKSGEWGQIYLQCYTEGKELKPLKIPVSRAGSKNMEGDI